MLAENQRRDPGDARRREAVAGRRHRLAAEPRNVDVDAAREELDRRVGVRVVEEAGRPPRGCPPRAPTRTATDTTRPACCAPRRRGSCRGSRPCRPARAAPRRTAVFVVERLMLTTSKPCPTAQRRPASSTGPVPDEARRRARGPSRAPPRARSSGSTPAQAVPCPQRSPSVSSVATGRRPRRARSTTAPASSPDQRMAGLDAAVEDADLHPLPVAPPSAHSRLDALRQRVLDRDPADCVLRQRPGGELFAQGGPAGKK